MVKAFDEPRNMEKDVERKIGLLHAGAGLVVGILTGNMYQGETLEFLQALILGMLFSYPLMPISRKIFDIPEKEFQFKEWLTKGYLMFFGIWIITWTFVYNL